MRVNDLKVPNPQQIPWNTAYADCLVNAPIQRVWEVLTDFPGYDAWNRFTYQVEIQTFEVGHEFTFIVNLARYYQRRQRERITRIEPPHIIAWSFPYDQNPLLNATRYQIMTPHDGNQTYYQTWETFTGGLAPFIKLTVIGMVQRGFEICARELKAYCERAR